METDRNCDIILILQVDFSEVIRQVRAEEGSGVRPQAPEEATAARPTKTTITHTFNIKLKKIEVEKPTKKTKKKKKKKKTQPL